MPTLTTTRALSFEEAALVMAEEAAVLVDLRPPREYFRRHVRGSIALLYEAGPGMAARARDCIPLDVPLVLLDHGHADLGHAAASLRGKGFAVLGTVAGEDRERARLGEMVDTEFTEGPDAPGRTLVDVRDPGAAMVPGTVRLPVELMWTRAAELADRAPLVVIAGAGVRAAMSVGILERAGIRNTGVWRPTTAVRR